MSDAAEVLQAHQLLNYSYNLATKIRSSICSCGAAPISGDFPGHQAAALTAAGFGLVAEPVVIHVQHDTEAHARSFNEGYETAIAQGLADDPALAGDWLDAKLADAKAEALESAATDAEGMHEPVAPDCKEWADWLRARAAGMRQP